MAQNGLCVVKFCSIIKMFGVMGNVKNTMNGENMKVVILAGQIIFPNSALRPANQFSFGALLVFSVSPIISLPYCSI